MGTAYLVLGAAVLLTGGVTASGARGAAAHAAPLTLLGGLLISGLLFGITAFQIRAREVAERAEKALREREEQLRLITDAVPALTAFAGAEDRRRALEASFQTHVPMPIEPDHLLAVVAELAGRMEEGRG